VLTIANTPDDSERNIIANELGRREQQLSEMHAQLFHGLHEMPKCVEEADAEVAAIRKAGAA